MSRSFTVTPKWHTWLQSLLFKVFPECSLCACAQINPAQLHHGG